MFTANSSNDDITETETKIKIEDSVGANTDAENDEISPLRCWDCNVNFTSNYYLYQHLLYHIKQPTIILNRIQQAPIKITLKSKKDNSFEIVSSPADNSSIDSFETTIINEEENYGKNLAANDENTTDNEGCSTENQEDPLATDGFDEKQTDEESTHVTFSPNYVSELQDNIENSSIADEDNFNISNTDTTIEDNSDYGNIPGAEPTPPPEPSPEYPKIRIKTTGLLKESSVTITEITDESKSADVIELGSNRSDKNNYQNDSWPSSSVENEKEDNNLLSLFSTNNERAKDLGFTSSESEFISLDRLDDRNRNALQLYNPPVSVGQNSLDSLTGLPMQQLAQQVSRLQPSNGLHQQNVLINIQQFPQAPPQQPQHGYQPPPPMYHPTHQPSMYQPYQYQPPNHMYYPPAGYPPPPHMPPPPPPQMGPQQAMGQHPQQMNQLSQQSLNQQVGQHTQQQMNQQHMPIQQPNQYGQQPMPQRPPVQRQPVPQQKPPQMGPRPMVPRQPMIRQRAPMPRPRGGAMSIRGIRPRMPNVIPQQGQMNQQKILKRTPEQIQALQAKRRKIDILMPDKNDDADCEVICTQPKNTDGGLPQIQSVQGGTTDPSDGNIMHLSDSITLSVRNPPQRTESPKKSDAKDVANILATRGITVTATAKPKEKPPEPPKKNSPPPPPPPPVAINLNSAVSIIPTAKQNNPTSNTANNNKSPTQERLPTVDLTDDSVPEPTPSVSQLKSAPVQQKPSNQRGALPFRCDLCPAQYPNSTGLSRHRQSYHKTGGPCEIGVPLINLKQTGVLQKLSSLGIYNYIPLPGANSDGTFAIPVINAKNPGNINGLGATSVLTLGPIRSIPRPQNSVNHVNSANNNSK